MPQIKWLRSSLCGAAAIAAMAGLADSTAQENGRPARDDASAGNTPAILASGRVFVRGEGPPNPDVEIDLSRRPHCAKQGPIFTRNWEVAEDGALGGVLVSLMGSERPPLDQPVVLLKKGCRFDKHLIVIPPGSTVRFETGDPGLQNVRGIRHEHGKLGRNLFNLALPREGASAEYRFAEEGIYRVESDIHRWMMAWIVVTKRISVVTDSEGKFSFEPNDVKKPAGLHFWHPQFDSPMRHEPVENLDKPIEINFSFEHASPAIP